MYATLIEKVPNLNFEVGLTNAPVFDPNTKNLVVMDDLMASRTISMTSQYMVLFKNSRNGQTYLPRSREIRERIVQRRDVGSVRIYLDRCGTGNKGKRATAHDHLSGRRRSVHLPDEDIKEQSRHSSRHLRYVVVPENTCVVSADAREKQEREIEESHHHQRRQ